LPEHGRSIFNCDEMPSVASDWVTGLFTLVGAGLGSAATMAANWNATRTRRDADNDGRIATVRREAYADYLSTADSFADRAQAVMVAIENSVSVTDCEGVFRAYVAEWEHLQRACSPVLIAGPPPVSERAADLRGQLGAMADECDRWYKTYVQSLQSPTRLQAGRFLQAQQAVRDTRASFIAVAQAHVYGGSPPVPNPTPAPSAPAALPLPAGPVGPAGSVGRNLPGPPISRRLPGRSVAKRLPAWWRTVLRRAG
jgi:hypothetical protein